MSDKYKILIGATKDAQEYAIDLKNKLNAEFNNLTINAEWWNEIFNSTEVPLTILESNIFDFRKCVFLVTPDDIIKSNDDKIQTINNKLLLNILLSYNYLGRKNTIIILPNYNHIILNSLRVINFIVHDFSEFAANSLSDEIANQCKTNVNESISDVKINELITDINKVDDKKNEIFDW